MIDLVLSNGNVYVWTAEDWYTLRKEHRIVGDLVGCLPKQTQQVMKGLPLLLMPEEAKMLLNNNIVRLIEYPHLNKEPEESVKKVFLEYRERLYEEQKICLKENRVKQVLNMMGRIVEGKKRKLLGLDSSKKKMRKKIDDKTKEALERIQIDEEVILEEEIAKLPVLDKSEALVQTHSVYPWAQQEDIVKVELNYPSNDEQNLRFDVFNDLWTQGYYVTSGEKFGGDFLVYPGDPIMYHALFIVNCQDRKEKMNPIDLIAQCRVACHVRKSLVLASRSEDGSAINYQSFQWTESSAV